MYKRAHLLKIFAVDAFKMGKYYTKRYLHTTSKQIITCMCYTSLIIGWHGFNSSSLFGVMSMEFLNENNELTTAEQALNLSLASTKPGENQVESFSSVSPLSQKDSIESAKLDFTKPNAFDNSPIQGYEYYCWNTSIGYEVKFN